MTAGMTPASAHNTLVLIGRHKSYRNAFIKWAGGVQ